MAKRLSILALFLFVFAGCQGAQYQRLRPPMLEAPVVNLPEQLRQRNWTGAGGPADGSCVHASLMTHMRWQNLLVEANYWGRTYSGGEHATRLKERLQAHQIKFAYTNRASSVFLDWAHDTRRGAILWWKPSHCCTFVGWVTDGRNVFAAIVDNNHPEKVELTERSAFLKRWEGYGGFGLAVLGEPVMPPPYAIYRER